MRQVTLLFLINDETREILLAMKKRGFGMGKYNGVGGKVGADETIVEAAVREAHEEVSVYVDPKDAVKVAELNFEFDQKADWAQTCHVFIARRWSGEPAESDEMAPGWYDLGALPYRQMWTDDKYWLPMVLRGDYVDAEFLFTADGSSIIKYHISGAPLL